MLKKILASIILCIGLTGCSNNNTDIIDKLKNKVNNLDSYQIDGELEVVNNESTYKYDISVSFEKEEKYKVRLKNKTNDHEQVILKNNEGVYVLTPSLNKSFKFQSEWPYNNSGSYLYQALINDIENDDKVNALKTKGGYIINTKVNYANNKDLVSQKIYLDDKANVKRVEVLDKNSIPKIKMNYTKVKHNKKFDDDYFKLGKNFDTKDIKNEQVKQDTKKTGKEYDVAYPLYIPSNTKLTNQETVSLEQGERTILTFSGDNSFTIVEEPSKVGETINSNGDFDFTTDVIGIIDDGVISFDTNGISYFAVSDKLDKEELLNVVNSISTIPVGK